MSRNDGNAAVGARPRPASGPRAAWMRRSIEVLGSGRLAIALLAALALLLFAYLFVPQFGPGEDERLERWVEGAGTPWRVVRWLGLTGVRGSAWLNGTFALLSVNLLVCLIRRCRPALQRCRFPDAPHMSHVDWPSRAIDAGCLDAGEVARILRRSGYRTLVSGDLVYGLRGRWAAAGHWLFHAGLLLLIVAGAWLAARPASFRGTIGVGEGESFDLSRAPFLSTNTVVPTDGPDLRFALERIDVLTDGGEVRRLEGRLFTSNGTQAPIAINRPYREGPYQVLAHGFGHMPGWVIVDRRGRMLKGAWVKLVPFPLDGEDTFRIGPKTSDVRVRFYPDHRAAEDGDRTAGDEPRNPRFRTSIRLLGEPIYDGLLAAGERVPIGDGREFFFLPEIRRYLLLDVMRETGHRVVFAILALMILGLVLRYGRLRKEILVRAGGGSPRISGRCEILESLFEEDLERLADEMSRRARGATIGRMAS